MIDQIRGKGFRQVSREILFYQDPASGEIIDDEKEVGGYPNPAPTAAPFVEAEWNLETMTPKSGRYPGQKAGAQEHLSPRDTQMRESAK